MGFGVGNRALRTCGCNWKRQGLLHCAWGQYLDDLFRGVVPQGARKWSNLLWSILEIIRSSDWAVGIFEISGRVRKQLVEGWFGGVGRRGSAGNLNAGIAQADPEGP